MKRIIITIIILMISLMLWGKSPEGWIETAVELEKTDINQAYDLMKEAKKEHPCNPDILSVYGYMAGLSAENTYKLRAAYLASSAISAFDDALELDSNHKNARLWRGILKINMPSFLGKVPAGVLDLETIEKRDDLTEEDYIMVKFFLGMGYGKGKRYEEAIASFEKVIVLNKNDEYHLDSLKRVEKIEKILAEVES